MSKLSTRVDISLQSNKFKIHNSMQTQPCEINGKAKHRCVLDKIWAVSDIALTPSVCT